MKETLFICICCAGPILLLVLIYTVFIANEKKRENKIQKSKTQLDNLMAEKAISAALTYNYVDSNKNTFLYGIDTQSNIVFIALYGLNDVILETIPFSEITDCKIISDTEIMGGVGRAVVGGMIAGNVGAIVGSNTAKKHVTNYQVIILRSNLLQPQNTIPLISTETPTQSTDYKNAVEFAYNVYASISSIVSQNNK